MASAKDAKLYTLAFIFGEEGGRDVVLLGLKKRGLGEGKWNGFGGKVEEGEDVAEAAAREVGEECGVEVGAGDLVEVGVNRTEEAGGGAGGIMSETHIFVVKKFAGEIRESEEMLPRWFALDDIPYSEMWEDDREWIPVMLRNRKERSGTTEKRKFEARFTLDGGKVVERIIRTIY